MHIEESVPFTPAEFGAYVEALLGPKMPKGISLGVSAPNQDQYWRQPGGVKPPIAADSMTVKIEVWTCDPEDDDTGILARIRQSGPMRIRGKLTALRVSDRSLLSGDVDDLAWSAIGSLWRQFLDDLRKLCKVPNDSPAKEANWGGLRPDSPGRKPNDENVWAWNESRKENWNREVVYWEWKKRRQSAGRAEGLNDNPVEAFNKVINRRKPYGKKE